MRQFGDVNQSLKASKVHEGAKGLQALHRAFNRVSYREILQKFFSTLPLRNNQQRTAAQNDILAPFTNFNHLGFQFESDKVVKALVVHDINLGRRHEAANALERQFQSTFVGLFDQSFHNLPFFKGLPFHRRG